VVGRNANGSDYIGTAARDRKGLVALSYSIQNGIVTNWDDMEKIWRYTFYDELRMTPEEHPLMLTETPTNPPNNREKTAQLVFEGMGNPALYLAVGGLATLYSYGKTTGLVVESGDGVTYVTPVVDGKIIKEAVVSSNLAGRVLTDFLAKLSNLSGPSSHSGEMIETIKRDFCYVAANWANESKVDPNLIVKTYEDQYAGEISVGRERFDAPEILFQPTHFGRNEIPLHQLIISCIAKCDVGVRASLYENIVLGGGNTMFPGMVERLDKELKTISPSMTRLTVSANSERGNSAWSGSSLMATNADLAANWMTKAQYDEVGAGIVNRVPANL